MSGYTIIIVFAIMVAASSAAYIFAPRGPNQTWAITYLAQLHPLIKPQTKFRAHSASHISP
ncbi:hypothetical protein DFQ27_006632 [Actinomortierella ambigua]|uniref:Uncharacterized protein n=1 Tax=Actinomortierella ambigua TaxID=1343610 RepID=A0A9P6PXU4_9FUNG|nr:hypothetical protein DFQ26_007951 [Actinomortierella ambigua]KAG0254760.1 hypothetical protein DFQ27_006632 [Actinomortierella ambigua]